MSIESEKTKYGCIQIMSIDDSQFIFHKDKFDEVVRMNSSLLDKPVGVIIINGALRTGKSFLSNLVIQYLLDSEKDMLNDHFRSRRGSGIQTLGIWIFNKFFVHDNMAIVLMDTQGIFDKNLTPSLTVALITLSTIISSYQIYNLEKRIQEDHLCNMAYFSAYSNLISNRQNLKIGQNLCLLVRDWQNYEDNFNLEKCEEETRIYKKELLSESKLLDPKKNETRRKIKQCYDDIDIYLCPHPGHLVTEGKFCGKLDDVRKDFMIHVNNFIKNMIQKIKPKRISGQIMTVSELSDYFDRMCRLYQNIQDKLPEPMTILETTEKICQENTLKKTISFYKKIIFDGIRGNDIDSDGLRSLHKTGLKKTKEFFNRLYIMGNADEIKYLRSNILKEINIEYGKVKKDFLKNNIISDCLEYFHCFNLGDFVPVEIKEIIKSFLGNDIWCFLLRMNKMILTTVLIIFLRQISILSCSSSTWIMAILWIGSNLIYSNGYAETTRCENSKKYHGVVPGIEVLDSQCGEDQFVSSSDTSSLI
jgi:atlastin